MSRTLRFAPLLLIAAFATSPASAQVATGTPPFGSFGGGPDVINLANLNAHITIPVLHKAGRGTNFTYDLSFDSSVWYPVTSGGTTSWQAVGNWGWRGQTEVTTGYVTAKTHTIYCANPDYPPAPPPTIRSFYTDTYVYHDTFGSPHPFDVTVQSAICGGGGEYGVALDGSGWTISFDISGDGGFWITSSSGAVIVPPSLGSSTGAATKTDRNGNIISVNGSGQFYDTLSSSTPVLTVSGSGTPTSPLTFTYTAPSGASAAYTVNYTTYTVQTNFGCGISSHTSKRPASPQTLPVASNPSPCPPAAPSLTTTPAETTASFAPTAAPRRSLARHPTARGPTPKRRAPVQLPRPRSRTLRTIRR